MLLLRDRGPLLVLGGFGRAGEDSLETLGDWSADEEICPGMCEGRLADAVDGCEEDRDAFAGAASSILRARPPPSVWLSTLPLASVAGPAVSLKPERLLVEGLSRW